MQTDAADPTPNLEASCSHGIAIMAAPKYEVMDRDAGPNLLKSHERLFIKQTKRGCVKELFGCEATNEFKIYPSQDDVRTVYCTGPPQCCLRRPSSMLLPGTVLL